MGWLPVELSPDVDPDDDPLLPIPANRKLSLAETETKGSRAVRTYSNELGEHLVEQLAGETCQNMAKRGEREQSQDGDADDAQVLTPSRNDNRRRLLATTGERVEDGTRAHDTWIHNPVPTEENTEKNAFPAKVGASGGALEAEPIVGADLQALVGACSQLNAEAKVAIQSIVEGWVSLPDAARDEIMAMVEAISGCRPTSTGMP